MDEYFEKVKADFLEVETFDLLQTNAFYNQYKDYLSENIPADKDDFEIYLEILADIGMTFAAKQKYGEALPILKKVVKKIKDSKEVKFWLGMIYSNLDKPILAYYYLSRSEPQNSNNPEFFLVLRLTKIKAFKKIFQGSLTSYIVFLVIRHTIHWVFPDFMPLEIAMISYLVSLLFLIFTIYYYFLEKRL